MSKKLYVGGLSYSTTNSQLEELFSKAGKVESVNVITDKFSGQGKGFGFVEMSTDEEAKKAIEMFNGYSLSGRTIIVNEARPKRESGFRGGYGRNRYGGGFRGRRR
ncbi:MAG: RNA-binding protein [Acidobacteriota bacterium]